MPGFVHKIVQLLLIYCQRSREITSAAAVITGDSAVIASDQVTTEELYEALNCSCAILGKDEPRAAPAPVGLAVGAHLGSSTQ